LRDDSTPLHLTSLSSRTTRHLANIEAGRVRQSLDNVARLASHGHLDRSPSLQLHLDDGIWHFLGHGQTGDVVERECQSEAAGWRQAIRIFDSGCAQESSPSHRDSSSSRLPAGRYLATHVAAVRSTVDPPILVAADGPAL
jgi:hypothetical protein